MKFDLIISNPPYQNLDLRIFKAVWPLTQRLCFIHPDSIIKRPWSRNSETYLFFKRTYEDFGTAETVPFNVFPIFINSQLMITYFDKTKRTDHSYLDYSFDETEKNILLKLLLYTNVCGNISQKLGSSSSRSPEKYYLSLNMIHGSETVLINKTEAEYLNNFSKIYQLEFDTLQELRNAARCLKTKPFKFFQTLRRTGVFIRYREFLPWLDFKKRWTEEMIYNEIGLSSLEREYIEKRIK
jgi:hypothetical protein